MSKKPFHHQHRVASLVVAIGLIVIVSMMFPAVGHGASGLAANPESKRPPFPVPTATVPLADPTAMPINDGDTVYVRWSIQEEKFEEKSGCCGRSSVKQKASSVGELTYRMPANPDQPAYADPFQMVVSFDREEDQDDGCMTHQRKTRILDGDKYSSGSGPIITGWGTPGLFTRYGSGHNWYIHNPISAFMIERKFTYEYTWHEKTGDPCQPYETGDEKEFISGPPTHDSEIAQHTPWIHGDGTSFSASDTWKSRDGVIITYHLTVTFSSVSESRANPMGLSARSAAVQPACGRGDPCQ